MPEATITDDKIRKMPVAVIAANMRSPVASKLEEDTIGVYSISLGEIFVLDNKPIYFEGSDTMSVGQSIDWQDISFENIKELYAKLIEDFRAKIFKDKDPNNCYLIYQTPPTVEGMSDPTNFNNTFVLWATLKVIKLEENEYIEDLDGDLKRVRYNSPEERQTIIDEYKRVISMRKLLKHGEPDLDQIMEQIQIEKNEEVISLIQEWLLDCIEGGE